MEQESVQPKSIEKPDLEPVLSAIMTTEEYSEIEHERPYVFELSKGSKELHYVGFGHSSDPKNPLFEQIESAFEKAQPELVFVEGVTSRSDRATFNENVKSATREQMIEHMGESGLAIKLALAHGADWRSPEPSNQELYDYLLKQGYSQDEIFAYEIIMMVPQYERQMKRTTFPEYVERYRQGFMRDTAWEDFDYSYDRAIAVTEQILGRPIDVENEPRAKDLTDPIPWEDKKKQQTVLNRVSASSSLLRDRKIVTDIADAFKTHDRLFVVYGASHAVMQEPALRQLFAELRA